MKETNDWMRELTPRELAQVYHALSYAQDYSAAGIPGHNHMMLIAKLAKVLDEIQTPKSV